MRLLTAVILAVLVISTANAEIYNVKDYGASGNGADDKDADDTSAIQAAIDAATAVVSHGGTVFFPAGSYRVTATLRAPGSSHGLNLLGEGKTRTVIYRDTDYGSTLIVGDPERFATENVTISGLWFYHDYGGYENHQPPSTMLNKPTQGAHIVAYGMTRGKITDCQFWNMPRQLHFVGGSISEVSFCTLRGSWDLKIPALQVTTENMYFEKMPGGIVPSSFRVVHNEIVGYISPERMVRHGTWSGMMIENVGPLYGIHIVGSEVIQIEGGNIASMSDSAILLNAEKAGDAMLEVYMSGIFFDGNLFAGVRIINKPGGGSSYNVHINDNTFIGQRNSEHAIWVGTSTDNEPPVKGIAIQDNIILSFNNTPIVINGGTGFNISGNQIRYYNCRGGYIDRLNASAIYVGPAARLVKIADNALGGGNSFEPYGAPFNTCEWGISYPAESKTVFLSDNNDFGINPRHALVTPYDNVAAVPKSLE